MSQHKNNNNNHEDMTQGNPVFQYWKSALIVVLLAVLLTRVQSLGERTVELESTMKQATTQMHDMVRQLNEQVVQLLQYQEALTSHLTSKPKPNPSPQPKPTPKP